MTHFAKSPRYDEMNFFPFKYIELEEVDSTSRYLKDALAQGQLPPYSLCLSQKQTAGYGQYGKAWLSDDYSLLFSLSIPLNAIEPMQLGNMSGVIALSILEALEQNSGDVTLKVKWPNDIHNKQGKVSGCLIELVKSADESEWIAVIGIGINRAKIEGDLTVGWIDSLDEEGFLKKLSRELVLVFQDLRDNRTPFSLAEWQSNDYFSVGESVFVYDSGTQLNGLYEGVNSEGYACVRMNDEIKQYASGAVSIRKANEKE